jgi:hypothetical protein
MGAINCDCVSPVVRYSVVANSNKNHGQGSKGPTFLNRYNFSSFLVSLFVSTSGVGFSFVSYLALSEGTVFLSSWGVALVPSVLFGPAWGTVVCLLSCVSSYGGALSANKVW